MRSGTLDVLQILLATAEKAAEQGTRPRQEAQGDAQALWQADCYCWERAP